MDRIEKFINDLRLEMSDAEIATALGNGDIPRPEWLSISESPDHIKVWDSESGASQNMGFIFLGYSD